MSEVVLNLEALKAECQSSIFDDFKEACDANYKLFVDEVKKVVEEANVQIATIPGLKENEENLKKEKEDLEKELAEEKEKVA